MPRPGPAAARARTTGVPSALLGTFSALLLGASLAVVPASGAAGGAGGAGAAAASQARSASSALSDGQVLVETTGGLDDPDTDPCSPGEVHAREVTQVLADGRQTVVASGAGDVAHDTDPADTVATSGTARVTATSTLAGDVRRVEVLGELTATNRAALGSATQCDVSVETRTRTSFDLDVLRPGYVTLSGSATRYTSVALSVYHDDTTLFLDLDRTAGTSTNRFWVVPGSYLVVMTMRAERGRDVAGAVNDPTTVRGTMRTSMVFTPAGTATAPASGAGTRAVTLPATLSCTARTASLRWRSPASRARVATVRVDGRLARTVRRPRPGRTLVVRSLPATSRVTLAVTVGRATARRTYEACRAPGY